MIRYDVKSALHDVLRSRGKSIVLFLGEIPFRELDPDLRVILKSAPCLHWSDRMFWEKLRFQLPPGSCRPPLQHYSLPIYEVPHLPPHLLRYIRPCIHSKMLVISDLICCLIVGSINLK